jgi:hypothetical protein
MNKLVAGSIMIAPPTIIQPLMILPSGFSPHIYSSYRTGFCFFRNLRPDVFATAGNMPEGSAAENMFSVLNSLFILCIYCY